METITKKEELLQWLEKVDDLEVLLQVESVKNQQKWSEVHDLEKERQNGYTLEEAKAEMRKRIAAYPWKK